MPALFRSAHYDYNIDPADGVFKVDLVDPESRKVKTAFSGLDRTRQEFREECDVNNVVRRFASSGDLGRMNPKTGQFLDVSEVPDLLASLDLASNALASFRELPDDVRRIVGDDPRRLMALADHLTAVRAYQAANPKPTPSAPPAPVVTAPVTP